MCYDAAAITRLLVEPDLRARVERERGALKALLEPPEALILELR